MELMEAMKARHSVRSYSDQRIEGETLGALQHTIDDCNRESELHIQLCLNEPTAFSGAMARYGRFSNVNNYIALVGKKSDDFDEKIGYYGEKVVIKAQQLGLNTCWVALTFSKGKSKGAIKINPGEKLAMVISLGYGKASGAARPTKSIEELCRVKGAMPEWFKRGMEAAQMAPTAMNQQKFILELDGNTVKAAHGRGFYAKVDLGIVKYHFELGAGKENFEWA